MEILVLLWLLLLNYPLRTYAACQTGDLQLVGKIDQCYLAGRMELCDDEGNWRSVCAGQWNEPDARVACRQMGYSDQGATSCTNSCHGRSNLTIRFHGFKCNGEEGKLINCTKTKNVDRCGEDVGIECRAINPEAANETRIFSLANHTNKEPMTTIMVAQRETSCTVTPSGLATTGNISETSTCKREVNNCAALSGGLGALTVLMALGMVGVALGWVWSCSKGRRKSISTQERASTTANQVLLDNPNYSTAYSTTSASPPRPLVRYSSTGPQNNSSHGTLEGVSSTYDVIKNDPHPTEGERDYQVLEEMEGGTYEVPIQMKGNVTSIDDDREDYSTLQHQ